VKNRVLENLFKKRISSPLGSFTLLASSKSLVGLVWGAGSVREKQLVARAINAKSPILELATIQLSEYFLGKRTSFDLPLDFQGTRFQVSVWKALLRIPFGKTWSYSELAKAAKSPRAFRAAGSANSQNPLSIIVPCHRVISKSGGLAGYAAGKSAKAFLLNHEGVKVKCA